MVGSVPAFSLERAPGQVAVLIAIDVPGGAGKGSLAAAIASRFDRAHVVCLDDFAKPTQQLRT
jgi:uridine kinase